MREAKRRTKEFEVLIELEEIFRYSDEHLMKVSHQDE